MNVLKPSLQTTIQTLLSKGITQREIERKTGIDRKTIRRYARLSDLGAIESRDQTPTSEVPPAAEAYSPKIPHPATALKPRSQANPGRVNRTGWIEEQVGWAQRMARSTRIGGNCRFTHRTTA